MTPIERRLKIVEDRASRLRIGTQDTPRLVFILPGETAHQAVLRTYGGEPSVRMFNKKPVPLIVIRGVNPDGSTARPQRVEPAGGEYVKNFKTEEDR